MKNKSFLVLVLISLTSIAACSQTNKTESAKEVELTNQKTKPYKVPTHRYGGWYCPDNLKGFPAVDIADWESVPVVNGRMSTKEETQNGNSLIFVDTLKYPNAKPLNLSMPMLAHFESPYSNREELIIVIQALNIDNDSVVGFRYLNGGNGSARLSEIRFLTDSEIKKEPESQFFSKTITIFASTDAIREVLTKPKNATTFQAILDKRNEFKKGWRSTTNVNYHYAKSGVSTSSYANELFGNYYIQNDYDGSSFTEKFLLFENEETKVTQLEITQLEIVCGPFTDDYESQKKLLNEWAKKVKEMSEKI